MAKKTQKTVTRGLNFKLEEFGNPVFCLFVDIQMKEMSFLSGAKVQKKRKNH